MESVLVPCRWEPSGWYSLPRRYVNSDSPYCPRSPPRHRSPAAATNYTTESKSQYTSKTISAPKRGASLTQRSNPGCELTLDGILRSPYTLRRQGQKSMYRGSPLQATVNCFNKRRDDFSKWGELLLNRGVQVKSHYL